MTTLQEKIRQELVVSEDLVYQEMITKVKTMIKLDSKGNTFFVGDQNKYTHQDQILLLLIGRWFAYRAGLTENDCLELEEMQKMIAASEKTVRARLAELTKKRMISREERGRYRIEYASMSDTLSNLERKSTKQ